MRAAALIATGLFVLFIGSAQAAPVSEASLDEVYRSCVDSAPAGTSAEFRDRFCGCFRDEARRSFTQESMTALDQRIARNATTMQDREQIEGMQRACLARVQPPQAPAATPVPQPQPPASAPVSAPPPPPPQAAPAQQPPPRGSAPASPRGTPLTEAELDTEHRECLTSMEQSAANVPADTRQRFCGCAREWLQRNVTREALAGMNQRQRANQMTMQDREQMQELVRVCMAQAQAPAPASTPPSAAPQMTPAPGTVRPTLAPGDQSGQRQPTSPIQGTKTALR